MKTGFPGALAAALVLLFAGPAAAQNDLSVTAITQPVSGCALTSTENVTIRIFNFGSTLPAATSFNVSYTINAGGPVTELVTLGSTLTSNSTLTYTFTTQANLSVPGTYTLAATVFLPGDVSPANDMFSGYVVTNTAPSVGGTVSGGTDVCISGNSGVLTLSGNTGAVLRWEYSTDGGSTWVTISNTTTTQAYNNLTIPTLYRAVVQNGGCTPATSSIASMTIDPASVGGTSSGSATRCSGANSGTITLSGKTGNVLRWEFSTDGGVTWNVISNTTTSQSYLNLTVTTMYHALVQSGSCASATSSNATITIAPPTAGGTVSPASSNVCAGANSGTLALAGQTGSVVRWEFSIDGGVTWTNIANATSSQSFTNVAESRLYRALVQSGPCTSQYSSLASVNVTPASTGGAVSPAAQTVCAGANSGTLTLSGQTGTILRWESSTDGAGTWTPIANTTGSQPFLNLAVSTLFRAVVQSGTCAAAASGSAAVTVSAPSAAVTASADVCPGTTGNAASVPDAGPGAQYAWGIANGTVTSGAGTRAIAYTASGAGAVALTVTVQSGAGCVANGGASVPLKTPGASIQAPASACASDASLTASVQPDQGLGAVYFWTIANGTITGGLGTRTITFRPAGASPVSLEALVFQNGCMQDVTAGVSVSLCTSPVSFRPIPPCRAVDTRLSPGPLGGLALQPGETRVFPLAFAPCGLGGGAAAAAVNVTAIPTAAGGLALGAGNAPAPAFAVVPLAAGKVRAVQTIVRLAPDGAGSIAVRNDSSGPVDLVLDVSGAFE
jgi:hypothetical protein